MSVSDIPIKRKAEIKQAVLTCLADYGKYRLPLPIEEIITNIPNVHLVTYSDLMNISKASYEQVIMSMGSEDSCYNHSGTLSGGIVFYNDVDPIKITSYRYRWSLAHELGHICLKHCSDEKTRICRNGLADEEYSLYEDEADYFAQLILVPHACIGNFSITKPKHIALMCKISIQASVVRFRDFIKWKSDVSINDEYDNAIFHMFYNFSFTRKCKKCNHIVIQQHGKYCIFCGNKNLEWSNEKAMKYSSPMTYTTGKLVCCPICNNEETNIEGNYCQICGTYLQNICVNQNCKQEFLPSNARYCPICGQKSLFMQNSILSAWDENKPVKTDLDGFLVIPEGIEEELPFN